MSDFLKELHFRSGKKIYYAIEAVDLSFDLDELEELKNFTLRGPFTESMSEKSPRYQEFLVSRYTLLRVLKSLKKKNMGGASFSLSHTREAVLLAAAPTLLFEGAALASGLGADIEHAHRIISKGAHKKIVNGGLDSTLPALALWSLKEAAFKAHPKNETLLLSDFYVSEVFDKQNFLLTCEKTQINFEATLLYLDDFQLAFALGRNSALQ